MTDAFDPGTARRISLHLHSSTRVS